jgi:cysteine desulfurase/selenocysteine lyase
MRRLGVSSSVRASFALYNTTQEVDAFLEALDRTRTFFS